MGVTLSQKSLMKPFCENSETLLTAIFFAKNSFIDIQVGLNTSLNKKKFFYIRIFRKKDKRCQRSMQARKHVRYLSTASM